MKTASKLFPVLLVLISLNAFADPQMPKPSLAFEPKAPVAVVSSRYQNLFVFKVSRDFKGAVVEVFHSDGDLVASGVLVRRKMVINFCDVKSGTYTIKVKKNNRVEEFQYIRK